jgi:hypothetical protein
MTADNLHICAPSPVKYERRVIQCPTCQQRRRFVCRLYEWYGWLVTCCACGDSWEDGERLPRPFRRGWRVEEARRAKRLWASIATEAAA